MSSPPRTASRAERRERLLDAADRAIATNGPDAAMTAIAAEAGITKPILYREFGDKGGLYRALAERHTAALLDELRQALATRGGLRARTRATVGTYLRLLDEHTDTYRFLMHGEAAAEPAVAGLVTSFLQRVGDVLTAGVRYELGLPPDDPSPLPAAWAFAITGMCRGAGDWWLALRDSGAPAPTRDQLAEQLTDLIFGAFPAQAVDRA
ncbi:MAG TPA: TetR family transcriptional regulator [Mycobacteriales bacterium]|nr:TetR family transcriptional regulator [Mycobacteriales bacterium]